MVCTRTTFGGTEVLYAFAKCQFAGRSHKRGHSGKEGQGGEAMKGRFILAVVVAVVVVLAAKYFGLFSGPVVLGGQVSSLVF